MLTLPSIPSTVSGNARFFALVLLGTLALCAAYAALVLNQATYADVLALGRITFHNGFYDYLPVRITAVEFALAQHVALAGAGALALAAAVAGAGQAGRQQLGALGTETRAALAGAWRVLTALPPAQRQAAGLSLMLLLGGRIYFGVVKSYHSEEVATYDFFIRQGLLAVSSYYPIPNNHVLPNTLSWLFYQVNPNVWFTLRLPVLLMNRAM